MSITTPIALRISGNDAPPATGWLDGSVTGGYHGPEFSRTRKARATTSHRPPSWVNLSEKQNKVVRLRIGKETR